MQILPLIAVLLRRRRLPDAPRVRIAIVAAASYAALFGVLLFQALRGQSVVAADPGTLVLLGVWTAGAAGALLASVRASQPVPA
jgi:hypothetical protein